MNELDDDVLTDDTEVNIDVDSTPDPAVAVAQAAVPDDAIELIDVPVADGPTFPPDGRPYRNLSEDRIRKVVDYYLQMPQPSYSEALIRGGGYSVSTGRATGYKFFKRPDVIAYLEKRRTDISAITGVTTERLVDRLKMIAFNDLSRFIRVDSDGQLSYDFTGATDQELKLINELTVDHYTEGRGPNKRPVKKFKFAKADTLRAIELLGRILGSFKDKTEVTGEISLVERLQQGRAQVRRPRGVKLIAKTSPDVSTPDDDPNQD